MNEDIFNEIKDELEYFKNLNIDSDYKNEDKEKCSKLYEFFHKILFPNNNFIGNTDPEKFDKLISLFYQTNKIEIHIKKRFEYESLVDVSVFIPTQKGYLGIVIDSTDYILYKPLIPHNLEK